MEVIFCLLKLLLDTVEVIKYSIRNNLIEIFCFEFTILGFRCDYGF